MEIGYVLFNVFIFIVVFVIVYKFTAWVLNRSKKKANSPSNDSNERIVLFSKDDYLFPKAPAVLQPIDFRKDNPPRVNIGKSKKNSSTNNSNTSSEFYFGDSTALGYAHMQNPSEPQNNEPISFGGGSFGGGGSSSSYDSGLTSSDSGSSSSND